MAKPRTRLGRQIDAALAQLGLPVLQSPHHRPGGLYAGRQRRLVRPH